MTAALRWLLAEAIRKDFKSMDKNDCSWWVWDGEVSRRCKFSAKYHITPIADKYKLKPTGIKVCGTHAKPFWESRRCRIQEIADE